VKDVARLFIGLSLASCEPAPEPVEARPAIDPTGCPEGDWNVDAYTPANEWARLHVTVSTGDEYDRLSYVLDGWTGGAQGGWYFAVWLASPNAPDVLERLVISPVNSFLGVGSVPVDDWAWAYLEENCSHGGGYFSGVDGAFTLSRWEETDPRATGDSQYIADGTFDIELLEEPTVDNPLTKVIHGEFWNDVFFGEPSP
jgi:hypothetical protein